MRFDFLSGEGDATKGPPRPGRRVAGPHQGFTGSLLAAEDRLKGGKGGAGGG